MMNVVTRRKETGEQVNIGDEIIDFRGTPWIFKGITDRGKVYVSNADDDANSRREFNTDVFGLKLFIPITGGDS